jgi:hypothetical protein
MNAERNRMMLAGLSKLLGELQGAGVKPVLLKGAASVVSGLYGDPAERIMADIDVLIAPHQIHKAEAALRSCGYRDADKPPRRWAKPRNLLHHLPSLVPPEGGFGVELHTELGNADCRRVLPAGGVLERAVSFPWRGHTVFVPSPADAVIHNIVHAQLNHRLHERGMVQLRQLRELAMLALRHRDDLDWAVVQRKFSEAGYEAVLAEQAAHSRILLCVDFPVIEADHQKSMDRLQAAILNQNAAPSRNIFSGLVELAKIYGGGLLRDPKLAINLLNPVWWPERMRSMLVVLRGAGKTTAKNSTAVQRHDPASASP